MYKSPIEIKLNDLVSGAVGKADEYIVRYVQKAGVNVDKDELIKALAYDRGQYEKGWNDRDAEIVRCKDCKWWDDFPIASATPHTHECSASYPRRGTCAEDYCSWGERRKDGKNG